MIDKKIIEIMERLHSASYQVYLVGGFVRDGLFQWTSNDIDLVTNASLDILESLYADQKYQSYPKYQSIQFNLGKYHFDISRMRTESCYYKKREVKNIQFVDCLSMDAKRRDFSINAIYMDIEGKIYDPLLGVKDIENKRLRLIGNASRLEEDPSRILRGIRLMLQFDLDMDAFTKDAVHEYLPLLKEVQNSVYSRELVRILKQDMLSRLFEEFPTLIKLLLPSSSLDISYLRLRNPYHRLIYLCQKPLEFEKTLNALSLSKKDKNDLTILYNMVRTRNYNDYELYLEYGHDYYCSFLKMEYQLKKDFKRINRYRQWKRHPIFKNPHKLKIPYESLNVPIECRQICFRHICFVFLEESLTLNDKNIKEEVSKYVLYQNEKHSKNISGRRIRNQSS